MDHESAEERDVDLVKQAYQYLTDEMYPNGATENRKRAIRNNARDSLPRMKNCSIGEATI